MSHGFSFATLDALLWITIAVVSFWIMPRFKVQVLILVSFVFLSSHDPVSAFTLVVFTVVTHFFTKTQAVSGKQATASIFMILAVLVYYKISIVTTDQAFFESGVIVPMGVSYYTLRCIHFIMERYKKRIDSQSATNLISYLFFLPTFWIGPIHRFESFDKDRRRHRWNSDLFSQGLERLLFGYFKVIVIANMIVNQLFFGWFESLSNPSLWVLTYFEMVTVGLTLYMLFSGYSDIAIGFGYLLGFKVIENFRYPFFQSNISAFWKNWHISLTSWCREYVYNTVVAQTRRPELGAMAALLVIAMWHEISLRYLLWGLYHGVGILIWQKRKLVSVYLPEVISIWPKRLMFVLSVTLTVHYVWLGFVLVRQPDINSMLSILKILFFLN